MLAVALAMSSLVLIVSARSASADWPPCTASLAGEGKCVPINGGVSDPATLGGPSSISISPKNCPKGSVAAQNGYSCSTPVSFSLAIPHDSSTVYNIHFTGPSSETDSNIVYNFVPATTVPNDYTGWCEINPATSGCESGNTKSLPLYLEAVRPIAHDTALTCVLGQYQYGDEFGDCIQISINATTKATPTTTSTTPTPRGHTVTGTIRYLYAAGDSFAQGESDGPTQVTPARETTVEVLDATKASCSDDVLSTVDTDDDGVYSTAVSSTQKYVCVKVVAATSYAEIIPYPSTDDVTGGAKLLDDAYASKALGPIKLSATGPTSYSWKPDDVDDPLDQALDVNNAILTGAQWLSDYGVTPKFINVLYPYPDSETTNFNPGLLRGEINRDDAFDWSVLLHEYGHFLASQIGVLNTTKVSDSNHLFGWNMTNHEREIKAQGLAIAWNEGFADFFSQMVQLVMGTKKLGLTDVGGSPPIYVDYTASETTTLQLNLPGNTTHNPSLGEDNEVSVARVLWYLYSQPSYSGVDGSVDFVKTLATNIDL